jgi:hypothetical protein
VGHFPADFGELLSEVMKNSKRASPAAAQFFQP